MSDTASRSHSNNEIAGLSALCELSERISVAGSLEEAFNAILDVVRDVVWYDEAFISTVDYERKVMTVQVCRGENADRLSKVEFTFGGDSLNDWALLARKAVLSPDASKDHRLRTVGEQTISSGHVVRSYMAIPLIVHDEVVGVLNVHAHAPNLYTEENVRILSIIASQAAALYKGLEALSALESYTDNILRSIAAGVLTLDMDGEVLTWNKAAEEIIGIPSSNVTNRHFSDIVEQIGVATSDKKKILKAIESVLEKGEKYLAYKQEFHPTEGGRLYINMSITQLRNDLGEKLGLVIIVEDTTKQVEMENEMRRISELAGIGQLAASIAHELRNPLSSIKAAAQYLSKEYDDHKAIREFLDIIIEEVNVLNGITTEFLDFARPMKLNLVETDMNDILFRTLQFMQVNIAKCGVEVEQNLAFALPRIIADEKQIEQVVRNIILNAIQAMPNGGKLIVKSRAAENGIIASISDTGVGISDEQLGQIFAPFFTTKAKGTGLGLSIVQKIVENHKGRISVKSTAGKGTTFQVFLPICSDRAQVDMMDLEDVAFSGDIRLPKKME